MKLTVLNVAYPLAPVGPNAVGGAEQVLTQLDAALVEAGHTSLVIASEGATRGTLLATGDTSEKLDHSAMRAAWERHAQAIANALESWPVHLVHMHGLDFYRYLPPAGVPVLATLHLPAEWYPPEVFRLQRPHTYAHCVSHSQHRSCPPGHALLPAVENGVPLNAFRRAGAKRGFALALGRICPEKGFHLALDAARAAQIPLLLAGKVFGYPAHETYFKEEIAPRLDSARRYIGPAGFQRKRRLLSAARCLLLPSLAAETSSLVAMEALACGTPVVAFRVGALPDIIEHGQTGFLVNDVAEMAEAIRQVSQLRPAVCREAAQSRFSGQRMTAKYLELYQQLAQLGSAIQPLRACNVQFPTAPSMQLAGLLPNAGSRQPEK